MDGCDGVDVRLQFGYNALLNFPSPGMISSSYSLLDRVSGTSPFSPIFGSGWDPLNQMEYLRSSPLLESDAQHPFLENEGVCAVPGYNCLPQHHSVSAFFEDPRISPAMFGPFEASEVETNSSNWEESDPNRGTLLHAAAYQKCNISGPKAAESPPPKERTRKRGAHENEEQKQDPYKISGGILYQKDEKKQKIEGYQGGRTGAKQECDPKTPGTSKTKYVHVKTRHGRATNSHSLAERVRREKISERMRVLQELVPGCSKITGKAVILDEIINYVQSLQQQIEFLAMKLATVSPGITINLDSAVSKHLLNSGGATISPGVGLYPHVPPGSLDG